MRVVQREAGWTLGSFWGLAETAAPARVVFRTNFGLGGSRMGRPFLILVSFYFGYLSFGQYTFPGRIKTGVCMVNDNSLAFKRPWCSSFLVGQIFL